MLEKGESVNYFPENESEALRLQCNHHIIKDEMNDKLLLAPIDFTSSPLNVLDSATADGFWLRDLAASVPPLSAGEHKYIGTDIITKDFPPEGPSNFQYRIQDINQPWPIEWNSHFDIVHQRLGLAAAGPNAKAAVQRMAELVKPGGWIQFVDQEWKLAEEDPPAIKGVLQLVYDILLTMGGRYGVIDEVAGWLRDFGFVDVEEKLFECKYGVKNKDGELGKKGLLWSKLSVPKILQVAEALPPEKISLSQEEVERLKAEGPAEYETYGHSFFLCVSFGEENRSK